GAEVDLHLGLYQFAVGRIVPDPAGVPAPRPALLLQKRQEHDEATLAATLQVVIGTGDEARGEPTAGVVVVVECDANLLEIILTGSLEGRLANLLHRRKQQREQDADDTDDHQQLKQGESSATGHVGPSFAQGAAGRTESLTRERCRRASLRSASLEVLTASPNPRPQERSVPATVLIRIVHHHKDLCPKGRLLLPPGRDQAGRYPPSKPHPGPASQAGPRRDRLANRTLVAQVEPVAAGAQRNAVGHPPGLPHPRLCQGLLSTRPQNPGGFVRVSESPLLRLAYHPLLPTT